MKKRTLLSCVFLLLAVSLCACAGDKDKNNASSTNAITVGIQQDLDSLDPHSVEAAGTEEVLFNVFEGLVKPNSKGELVGAIAESYTISEDGKVYTFTLRDGVKFHNGQTVTMEDVKYSMDRVAGKLDGQTEPMIRDFKAVDTIKVVDSKTLEITLVSANTEFIAFFTSAIIPKDYADVATKPIGTGPFRFVSYTPQQSFVVEKFDEYWGQKAYLDKVTFQIIANADSSVLLALNAGTIDLYPYLTADQAEEAKKTCQILNGTTNLVQALFLNNEAEPFNNPKVRQALCYALDPQQIIDMVGGGYGQEIGSNFFPAFSLYYDPTTKDVYHTDLEKAKELLKEAGYENGFSFTITAPSNYQFHMDTATVLVEQFKKIGVQVTIKPVDWATWLSDVYKGRNYEATIVGLDAELAPSDLLSRYRSDASNNFINYKNEEFDAIFDKALSSVSQEEKVQLYKELQQILTKDAASVYIQDAAKLVAMNPKLEGYEFYPLYVLDMSTIRFK